MYIDKDTLSKRYIKFIQRVTDNEEVYILMGENGAALSTSLHFEDEDGNASPLICFWSKKSQAQAHIREEWQDYKLFTISLDDLRDKWLPGMHYDQVYGGLEFDQNFFGIEKDPLDLLRDLE